MGLSTGRQSGHWHSWGLLLTAVVIGTVTLTAAVPAVGRTRPTVFHTEASGFNHFGQLGNGTNTDSSVPVGVSGLARTTEVSAGALHSLARLPDGTVVAWGSNFSGELGIGTTDTFKDTPVPVTGLTGVKAVSAGGSHSLALLANGTAMAWGDNQYGELGNGTQTGPEICTPYPCSRTPVATVGLTGVKAVSAGYSHSLALLSNGTVMDWGSTNGSDVPVAVSGLTHVKAISAGDGGSLGLLTNHTVMAWEGNGVPALVSGLTGVKAVAAGFSHNLALLGNGTVVAWVDNEFGELGNDTNSPSSVPEAVSGLTGVKAISASYYYSLALLTNGTVMAWGRNFDGELGNGSNADTNVPVGVSALANVRRISAGQYHVLAKV